LQIVDFFEPSPGGIPHGFHVTNAALATEYQGPIQATQAPLEPRHLGFLAVPYLPAASTLQNLDLLTQSNTALPALAAASTLQRLTNAGVSQTVTNLSWGAAPADTVDHVYQNLRLGWTPAVDGESDLQVRARQEGGAVLGNLARAFDVPLEDLTHQDAQVSGPARQQLQQHLIDRVEEANRHASLDLPRAAVRSLADAYEGNHNSLVVAAGNQGQLLEIMEADNGGRTLSTGPDFFTSVLAVPNATVVGSLAPLSDGSLGSADYSSPSPNVDVNAWGRLTDGVEGTSFAAPRVAALMQQLHVQNPTATSAQVEEMMMEQFFQQSPYEPANVVREYMSGQTW